MLKEYYLKMLEDTSEMILVIKTLLVNICENRISDNEIICDAQSKIIDWGNSIEKEYSLTDSDVIHLLESIADDLYMLTQEPSDEVFLKLKEDASQIDEAMRLSKKIEDKKMALVLIIKNEARYVEEWINFHLMLGVDHFYIYDNESTDDLQDILRKYEEDKVVTYHWWPGRVVQLRAYNHALENYKYDTKYMGFIDTDEFLFPVEGFSLPDTVNKVFDAFDNHIAKLHNAGGIGVNWRSYGTSHIKEPVSGLVIDNFRLRGKDDYPQNVHIKTIVKPTLTRGFFKNPHSVEYFDANCYTISEHGSLIPSAYFFDSHCDILRINHYYTRSESELYYKMNKRGWADISDEKSKEYAKNYSERLVSCNDIQDDIVDKFIPELKKRMKI